MNNVGLSACGYARILRMLPRRVPEHRQRGRDQAQGFLPLALDEAAVRGDPHDPRYLSDPFAGALYAVGPREQVRRTESLLQVLSCRQAFAPDHQIDMRPAHPLDLRHRCIRGHNAQRLHPEGAFHDADDLGCIRLKTEQIRARADNIKAWPRRSLHVHRQRSGKQSKRLPYSLMLVHVKAAAAERQQTHVRKIRLQLPAKGGKICPDDLRHS